MSTQLTSLTDAQQVQVALQFLDAANNVIFVPGIPTWTVDDPTILTINTASDNLSANLVTLGPVGVATVTVSLNTVNQSLIVTVLPSGFVSISFVIGSPTTRVA